MKKRSIKEFRMDVGSGDGSYNLGKHTGYGTMPAGADSTFSRNSQALFPTDYFEEESSEEIDIFENVEVNTDIEDSKDDRAGTAALIGRLYRQKGSVKAASQARGAKAVADASRASAAVKSGYSAAKTAATDIAQTAKTTAKTSGIRSAFDGVVKAILPKAAEESAEAVKKAPKSFLSKIPGLAKIGAAAIPVLDIAIATATIVSALNKINDFNLKFNSKLNLVPGSELPNYLVDANDREFSALIEYIQQVFLQDDNLKDAMREDFNEILQTFKDLFIIVCVAVTPYITAVGGLVATPIGSGIAYIGTKASGITVALTIHAIPAERILFELGAELTGGIDKMFKIFESHEDFKEGSNAIQRDSLAYCFVADFIQSLTRMGKIYNALYVNEATALDKVIDSTASAVGKMSEHNENKYMLIINEVNAIDEYPNYAARANSYNDKLLNQTRKGLTKLDEEEDSLDEFSGVGALGGNPVTPIGTDATGKRVSRKAQAKRKNFVKKRSFPYK